MRHRAHLARLPVFLLALAIGLAGAARPASAQSSLIDAIQSGLDEVARGMNYIGEMAGGILGPGLGDEKEADFVEQRTFEERHPVDPAPEIYVSNEFGAIRVSAWDERVVSVAAELEVGAESSELAAAMLDEIDVRVQASEESVTVRTFLPDARSGMGMVRMAVNYTLYVPRAAQLFTENFFGDTTVRGVNGPVVVESQYGVVELADLGGPLRVRAHGEFPLRAFNLLEGGLFELHGPSADIAAFGGDLKLNSFRGDVSLRGMAPHARVEVEADSADVSLLLADGEPPDLSAAALFGDVVCDLPHGRSGSGRRVVVRSPNIEAHQEVVLSATFGDIAVRYEEPQNAPESDPPSGATPFNDVIARSRALAPGTVVRVEAGAGDIQVRGVDGATLSVTATRVVWVATASEAADALSELQLQLQESEERINLVTLLGREQDEDACTSCRVDLVIECPRFLPLEIVGTKGLTTITGMQGAVNVQQAEGVVRASALSGETSLANQNGSVQVTGASGPVDVSARYGDLRLEGVAGRVTARCVQGRTIVDSPRGDLFVRNTGGDIRILALSGVGGDFDALVEDGNLSLVLAPEASVTLTTRVQYGSVHSAFPLSGAVSREKREYHGSRGDGAHRIILEAIRGDIVID